MKGCELYEVEVPAGKKSEGITPYADANDVNLFYVISGNGHITFLNDNSEVPLLPDTYVTTNGADTFEISAYSKLRIAVVLHHNDHKIERFYTTLKKISNTERDVSWGNGQSRRFAIKKDGLGFAFANTLGWTNCDSSLEYKHHKEFW